MSRHKRPRAQQKGDTSDSDVAEASEASHGADSEESPSKRQRREYPRGTVKQVKVLNFMTYGEPAATIKPGSRLNLVLGPNGTGKSSFVCALCIGLGGSTKLLGRADNVKEYIKRGTDRGWVETTLSGGPRQPDIVIRCDMEKTAEGYTTSWRINRVSRTKKEVTELVRSINIQFENLCQFLPQDKVVEFARMNEYELLVATERAVGSTSLYETHQTLIAMRAEVKQKEVTAQAQKQRLDQLKLENQQLERDYKRFNQRWKLLHRVDVMKKKIAWMHVREKQLKAKQLKEELVKADKAVAQANEEAKGDETPARRRRDDADAAKRTANDLQNAIKRKEEEARLAADKLEKDGNAVTELRERLDGLAAASQKQKAEVKQLQDKLTKVEATVESLPPVPDHSAKIQVLQQEMNNIRDQLAHLEAEKGQLADAAHNARIEHGRLAGELRQCDSLKYQRMQALVQAQRAHGLDSATDWVNRQRAADAFKGEVVGPIGLEIKVKVPDCAPYLEQAAWWQLQNFAVTHQEDANMLLAEFKRQNIRSSAVAYTGDIHAPIASNSAPYRAYGVACSLDEVYDAHPLVKHCLANLCSLDKVLVMEQHNMQAIRALMEQHHIGQVFTPQLKVSYIPSAHGGREDASIATSGLFPSRVLTGAVGADIDQRKQQLQARLAQVEASIQQLDGQVAAAQQREAPLHARLDELSGHRSQLAKETSLASTKRANLNRAYKAGQTHLAKLEARADPLAQAPGLERQIARALVAHHATLTKQIEAALKQWQLLQQHAVAELVWRELDMQAVAMQRALDSRRAAVRLLDKAARAAKQRYQLAEDEFKRAKQVAETEHPLDKATKDRFANMPNDIETLEEEVETLKQQAAELVVNDPHVVENYQLRQTEIEGLEQQVAELQDQLGAAQQEMDRLKENWLPELQRIVGLINTSFSSNFSQIGCAGEVLLGQHEDYDKFSIQIKVKFREEEELQLLTAQRQSGGERSVSTILYLIALQGVTVTPFRVVDEINQGMDPVNERKVFTQLVEASCKEGTPQCFLLTPKLLPDLPFTEDITVLHIFNGGFIAPEVAGQYSRETLFGSKHMEALQSVGMAI